MVCPALTENNCDSIRFALFAIGFLFLAASGATLFFKVYNDRKPEIRWKYLGSAFFFLALVFILLALNLYALLGLIIGDPNPFSYRCIKCG